MTYATQQHLTDRFGLAELIQRTDKFAPYTGAIVTAVMDRALADADAEIDGFVSARYALPLPTVPAVLTLIACDITRFRLFDTGVPEAVRQRYEDAIARLKDISAGRISLGLDPASAPPVAGTVSVRAGTRIFDADSLKNY